MYFEKCRSGGDFFVIVCAAVILCVAGFVLFSCPGLFLFCVKQHKMKTLRQHRILPVAFLLVLPCLLMAAAGSRSAGDVHAGKNLYEKNCAPCHGADGAAGRFGAKNLQKSMLADAAITERITKGKRIMPSFGKRLTQDEIGQVAAYIKTLRNNQ
jgi:mono/diheme cytochrome c family protein